MKRNAFTMKLKPGTIEEYKRRHTEIWPELKQLLSDHGISDYAIYIDPTTHTLFAVQKRSGNFDPKSIPKHPIVKKWWAYMADIMETNPDHSPIESPLIEMFHMD